MERADDVRHRLRGSQGLGVYSFEIEVELGIGIAWRQICCQLAGERGFSDASQSPEPKDGTGSALDELGTEGLQVLLTACEVGRRRGELVKGGRRDRGYTYIGDLVPSDDIAAP